MVCDSISCTRFISKCLGITLSILILQPFKDWIVAKYSKKGIYGEKEKNEQAQSAQKI